MNGTRSLLVLVAAFSSFACERCRLPDAHPPKGPIETVCGLEYKPSGSRRLSAQALGLEHRA